MHSYCPRCHTTVHDYLSDASQSQRGMIGRVGSFVLNLLLVSFIIGASVMIARAINWKEFVNGLKETVNPSSAGKADKDARKNRLVAPKPDKPQPNKK